MGFPPAKRRAKSSELRAALFGGFLLLLFLNNRLAPVQEISGALRMGGCGKDRPLVVLQDLQPALNIGRMIGAHLWSQFQIGT